MTSPTSRGSSPAPSTTLHSHSHLHPQSSPSNPPPQPPHPRQLAHLHTPTPSQSPSHYSNRAREKRCSRAKELLVELIKSQTSHQVDPKDIKTTKPSSAVSWRFIVDPGTEFPLVQLSSISRPNLDLLEKAIEGGGVRVTWQNENELNRAGTDEDVEFIDAKRPRKRTRHSADSPSPHQDFDDSSTALRIPLPQSSASHIDPSTSTQVPPAVGLGPSTSFTTVNGPRPQLKHQTNNHVPTLQPILSQPQLASPPTTTSPTTNSFNHNEPTVSIDIPLSSISRVLDSQRNSVMEQLRAQNTSLSEDNVKLKMEYETMQSKYNALEEQLRKKMSQMQEILEGKKSEEGEENAD